MNKDVEGRWFSVSAMRIGFVGAVLAFLWPPTVVLAQACREQRTDTVHFHSAATGEDRVVLVRLPSGYCGSTGHYPVLYMLDADMYLDALAGTLDFLSANDASHHS